MTDDEIQHTLAPLAREPVPPTRDVTTGVMRDVRRLAIAPIDDDRLIWRLAACASAAAAVVVVVASIAVAPSENPLAEFAAQTTTTLELR